MSNTFARFFVCKRIAMATTSTALCFVFASMFEPISAQSPFPLNIWISRGPSAYVNTVNVDPRSPNIIYAGTNAGVFKSLNYGASWFNANLSDGSEVEVDQIHPNTIYASTSNGVSKSTDGGVNWSSLGSPVVHRLAVSPSDPNYIYAATDTSLVVTTNGGAKWTTRTFPVAFEYINFLEVDPQNPRVIYVFLSDYDFLLDLYKSSDGGLTWTQLAYGGGYHVITSALKFDPANSNIVYTATFFGIYKSTNGGTTWTLGGAVCVPGFPCDPPSTLGLAIDPLADGTVYTTRYNGSGYNALKSTNNGVTWGLFNDGFPGVGVNDFAFDRTGSFLYAATPTGVYGVMVREGLSFNRIADFDGDGRSDVSVFRPADRVWYLDRSTLGFSATQFGLSSDQIVPADYDGDGKTDVAIFRPSSGSWFILNSGDGSLRATQFGQSGDIAATGDYDADGRADICVYRPSTSVFYLLHSSDNSFHFQAWGLGGDVPVMGDYEGDGRTDFGVYRAADHTFYILQSVNNSVIAQPWGLAGDRPLGADFDGDGKTDIAIYRPATGNWYILQSSDGVVRGVAWGTSGDIPSAADYDGDGRSDVAVFRPASGIFYILQSASNSMRATQFGADGDIPVPSAYMP